MSEEKRDKVRLVITEDGDFSTRIKQVVAGRGRILDGNKVPDGYGDYKIPKKRIYTNGVWKEVEDREWIEHVKKNPNGKTAKTAIQNKDPDYETVLNQVPNIPKNKPIENRGEIKEQRFKEPIVTKTNNLSNSPHDEETIKRENLGEAERRVSILHKPKYNPLPQLTEEEAIKMGYKKKEDKKE